jgi:triphosphoribosyl-dephospho-CoA synthase
MNTGVGDKAMALGYLIGLHAQLACIWEATARKAGNVHRYCDFADTTYIDFLQSAAAIAPILAHAPRQRVGVTVLEAIRLSARHVASNNTNLGIVLLLAPLAKAAGASDIRADLPTVLDDLNVSDAEQVYAAIRLANPGGLGRVPSQDVAEAPTKTLREVMQLAADRDLIARQYAYGFREVFDDGVPAIRRGLETTGSLEAAILNCQLHLMAQHPDSLIRRKRGEEEAAESAERAKEVLAADWPQTGKSWSLFHGLDNWLRAIGNQRNPGTTADLITATLFVCLEEAHIQLPVRFAWPDGPDGFKLP